MQKTLSCTAVSLLSWTYVKTDFFQQKFEPTLHFYFGIVQPYNRLENLNLNLSTFEIPNLDLNLSTKFWKYFNLNLS